MIGDFVHRIKAKPSSRNCIVFPSNVTDNVMLILAFISTDEAVVPATLEHWDMRGIPVIFLLYVMLHVGETRLLRTEVALTVMARVFVLSFEIIPEVKDVSLTLAAFRLNCLQ